MENKNDYAHPISMETQTCNILIIEDDEADRTLCKTLLKRTNDGRTYQFYEAETGKDGERLFNEIRPDCVLLDYNLPDTNAINLLKKMAEKTPILPVVILTGQGDEHIAAESIKNGAQNYISKNIVNAEALNRIIANTIDRAALLKQVACQNEDLKEEKMKAQKADKAKSDFLATMSHEIRTPLNGIIGMAELLSFSDLDPKQKQFTKSILSSGDLLLTIINDILDFSKIEAQEMELESKTVHIDGIFKDIIQLLSSRANENRVELILNWPFESVLPPIKTDPVRLRQILINIVSNAVKFTRDGQIIMSVIPVQTTDTHIKLRFEVKDTGVGIPEDKIDTIFSKFTQVDSSTTREYGGTGLGLAICAKLVDMMGGDLGVESEVGKGSVFHVDLEFEIANAKTENNDLYKNILKDKRILVVDNHIINIHLFSNYLNITGAHVDGSESGIEALSCLKHSIENKSPYDLVLMDCDMPKMDGLALAQKITKKPTLYGTPKMILLSALGRRREMATNRSHPFSAHLFKPVFPIDLLKCTAKALDGQNWLNSITPKQSMPESLPQFKAHILIVEDDRISQRMARNTFKELGCTFDVADDGLEAIEELEKNYSRYDLIFMDWQMPNMDGHTAIRHIRKQEWGKNLKIVALTANAIQGDRDKCLNAGADDYVAKPIRISEIAATLDKYCPDNAQAA